jgi:hypothetical protein
MTYLTKECINGSPRDLVNDSIRLSVYNSVYNSVWDSVTDSVYNSVWDSVYLTLYRLGCSSLKDVRKEMRDERMMVSRHIVNTNNL